MPLKTGKFPRTEKIRGKANFAKFARSRQYKGRLIRIAVLPLSRVKLASEGRKVAFAVGKKISSQAVERNKIKRRLRELYRKYRYILPENIWLMIIAISGSKDATYQSLEAELKELFTLVAAKNGGNKLD